MVDVEPLKRSRVTAKRLFTKAKNNLIRLIDSESDIEIIGNRWADLKRNFLNVQEKHADYISTLEENDPAWQTEVGWIGNIDHDFDDLEFKKIVYVRMKHDEKVKEVNPVVVGQSEGMQHQCFVMRKMEEATFNSILSSLESKFAAQMKAEEPVLDIKDELLDLKRQ